MARLSAAERAALPDRAFAYVDSAGKRRLPIYDESHVRNALARFDQVHFESEGLRDEARRRLLNAAKRFKIVPVGFIEGQLEGGDLPRADGQRRRPPSTFDARSAWEEVGDRRLGDRRVLGDGADVDRHRRTAELERDLEAGAARPRQILARARGDEGQCARTRTAGDGGEQRDPFGTHRQAE
jgi:hypothetical protein